LEWGKTAYIASSRENITDLCKN